jgi:Metal-dependent hydrolase
MVGVRKAKIYAAVRTGGLVSSFLLLAVCAAVYAARPDWAAAITVFPVWIWTAPGLLLLLPQVAGRKRQGQRKSAGCIALLWLLYVGIVAEEPRTLLRSLLPAHQAATGVKLRVISLNCAGGDPQAAEEVAAYRPDVVLLQEAPPTARMPEVAAKLFGNGAGWIDTMDAAIVVRGSIEALPVPKDVRGSLVYGRAHLAGGPTLDLASLRLMPALFRMDLWSSDCWRAQAENRRIRRAMLREMATALKARPAGASLIVAGDFNAPQGDAVFGELFPGLHGAFDEAGVGWGNTITNELPVLRIDQLWVSSDVVCQRAVAQRTIHSDHRMVVCDLIIQ